MRRSVLVLSMLLLSGCATFDSGNIEYRSALTSPNSKSIDSVYVFLRQYSPSEAKLIFDFDFRYTNFEPVYLSIFNQSKNSILIDPKRVSGYVPLKEVYEKTKSASFSYFLVWSTPWIINLVAGWPFYYGLIWPVFGFVAAGNSLKANTQRGEFYAMQRLNEIELQSGQETFGIVFISKHSSDSIFIPISVNEDSLIFGFKNETQMIIKR